jgi:hypothetical protein
MTYQKIRLTYLWTDEKVMLEDFSTRISLGMTDWANEFYRRYGFELDVDPPPDVRSSVKRASKYALRKSDGIAPDVRTEEEIASEDSERLKWIREDLVVTTQRKDQAEEAQKASAARVEAGEAALAQARAGGDAGEVTRLELELERLRSDAQRASDERYRLFYEWISLLEQEHELSSTLSDKVLAARQQVYQLRDQMSEKFVQDLVGSDDRLSIVFCRFYRPLTLRMRQDKTSGVTMDRLFNPVVSRATNTPIWNYPFVLVDLAGQDRTVAHELLHATGHGPHPDSQKAIAGIKKRIVGFQQPRGTIGAIRMPSLLTKPEYEYQYRIEYDEIPGGYFDGADNDIMNYTLDNPKASKVILSEKDKGFLADAFFVREKPKAP